MVVDAKNENSSSSVAAGIINPVTGRRYVTTWMIDDVISFAIQTYTNMGKSFKESLITERSIIDFFPSPQMRNAFVERIEEDDTYLHTYPDQNYFNQFFNYEFGCGEIRPAYTVHLQQLLSLWRSKLAEMNLLVEQKFDLEAAVIGQHSVQFGDISAEKIIFCDGVGSILNPFFQLLPFAPNKGEALIIKAEGLTNEHVFKKGMLLVPFGNDNLYWVGSSYQWAFDNDQPSTAFLNKTTALLKQWLKAPFEIVAHKAAVRSATLERRPFVGFHPLQNRVGILNGMGTKGSSLAPFFAHQLAQHLVHGIPIADAADIRRFSRILSK